MLMGFAKKNQEFPPNSYTEIPAVMGDNSHKNIQISDTYQKPKDKITQLPCTT